MKYRVDFCLLRGKAFSEKKSFTERREYPDDGTAMKMILAEIKELLIDWEKIMVALFKGKRRVKTWGRTSLTQSQYMKRSDEVREGTLGIETFRFGGPWDTEN